MEVLHEHGAGNEAVYVYWFPSQETIGDFPCKIGKAKNPRKRIVGQSTSMQERPKVEIFWTEDSFWLEKLVHTYLSDCRIDPKKEWFQTNPVKVRRAVIDAYDDHQNKRSIFEKLRAQRQKMEMSQAILSQKMGSAQSTISDVENGTVDPSFSTLQKIADALDLEITVIKKPL